MANQWLRLWHELPNDPKFRTVAKVAAQPVTAVLSVYLHLMVSASANANERGRTKVSMEDVATALEIEIEAVEAIIAAMQGRMLDGNWLSGWEERQPVKEDGSAERSKAWREAKKAEEESERNRTQTNETERKRTQDKEEDKDKEKKKKYVPGDLAVAKFIWGRILILSPKAKEPNFDSWADSIRLMREADSRTHDEICQIFTWANQHKFWKTNILSPPTLREKFDRLTIEMQAGTQNGQTGQRSSSNQTGRSSASADVSEIAARERAKLAAARSGGDYRPVGADDAPVWPQVDESIRQGDRSGECLGGVIEGSYERAS